MRIYLAGPMRGIPGWNFPAFDAAAARLRAAEHDVVNPADLDRAVGVDEHMTVLPAGFMRAAMARDTAAICTCDAVAVLPGWRRSRGARAEVALARAIGLDIFDADDVSRGAPARGLVYCGTAGEGSAGL